MNSATRLLRRALFACTALSGGAVLNGCATIPDVSVSYRPVKWAVAVTVVHTLTCNRANNLAAIQRGATFLPFYSAAPENAAYRIQLKDLDGFYADSDITFGFTDDGRLKSINQTTMGQGETVLKSGIAALAAISVGPAAAPATAPPAAGVHLFQNNVPQGEVREARASRVCAVIRSNSIVGVDQLPQVSLVQTAVLHAGAMNTRAVPSKDQEKLLQDLKVENLDLSARISAKLGIEELQPISNLKSNVTSREVPLTLQRMVALSAKAEDGQAEATQGLIGSKSLPVPTTETFVLPIPKAALFGKQTFVLSLAESGRISTLGYGRTTGVPGAFNAATAASTAEITEDNAGAAALKAAADLIAQQQRFNTCKLKPTDCK